MENGDKMYKWKAKRNYLTFYRNGFVVNSYFFQETKSAKRIHNNNMDIWNSFKGYSLDQKLFYLERMHGDKDDEMEV